MSNLGFYCASCEPMSAGEWDELSALEYQKEISKWEYYDLIGEDNDDD